MVAQTLAAQPVPRYTEVDPLWDLEDWDTWRTIDLGPWLDAATTTIWKARERLVSASCKTTNLSHLALEPMRQLPGTTLPFWERRAGGTVHWCPLVGVAGAVSVSALSLFDGIA